jgi:HK97 family phage major capsid protein
MSDNKNTVTPEPEVVEAVKAEIAKLGEGFQANKKNYEDLRKTYEALKEELETNEGKFDALITEKVTKLTEDITTRQESIDDRCAAIQEAEKQLNKRCDEIEVAMKRSPKQFSSAEIEDMAKLEVKSTEFMINALTVQGKGKGVTTEFAQKLEPNVEEYKAYTSAFPQFLRLDERQHISYPDMVKALSVGIDPDGGYTVTPTMSNRIITRLFESDPIRQLASVETISTDALEWLVDYDEAGYGWEAETTAGDETTTPKIFKKRIPVHVLYAKPRVSQTLLEDSAINIESWLADKVANRFMRGEGEAFISGNGVGQPRGILTYADYDTPGVDQWGRIERQNMGAAAAVTADGFIDVKYRLIEHYLQRATWLMNRLTVAATMGMKNGQGDYIWKPGLTEERNSTILGLDVRMSTTMPTIAAGAMAVVIADWTEAYMIVDRLGITIQRDPFTQKPMIEFYTRKRVGGDVINFQAIKIGVIAA